MRKGKTMRKRLVILTITILLIGSISNTYAQIYIMEDEMPKNRLENTMDGGFAMPGIMPEHDTTWDYTPIGDGLWTLACLGFAYLMQKKRKKNCGD